MNLTFKKKKGMEFIEFMILSIMEIVNQYIYYLIS